MTFAVGSRAFSAHRISIIYRMHFERMQTARHRTLFFLSSPNSLHPPSVTMTSNGAPPTTDIKMSTRDAILDSVALNNWDAVATALLSADESVKSVPLLQSLATKHDAAGIRRFVHSGRPTQAPAQRPQSTPPSGASGARSNAAGSPRASPESSTASSTALPRKAANTSPRSTPSTTPASSKRASATTPQQPSPASPTSSPSARYRRSHAASSPTSTSTASTPRPSDESPGGYQYNRRRSSPPSPTGREFSSESFTLIGFDLETGGFGAQTHAILSIGLCTEHTTETVLVKPGTLRVEPRALEVNRLSLAECCSDGLDADDALRWMRDFFHVGSRGISGGVASGGTAAHNGASPSLDTSDGNDVAASPSVRTSPRESAHASVATVSAGADDDITASSSNGISGGSGAESETTNVSGAVRPAIVLVAHNAGFDVNFLRGTLGRCENDMRNVFDSVDLWYVDTLELVAKYRSDMHPYRSQKLTDILGVLKAKGVDGLPSGRSHEAGFDAAVALFLFRHYWGDSAHETIRRHAKPVLL
eukprot:Opistho-2@724